eukprot:Lithocolla_globosa_v1_NODE_783_length_3285_cov_8.409598.p1 type:complete len:796 gc:universal NODE_783_length_3285_cov_8.409598:768-3155(+)
MLLPALFPLAKCEINSHVSLENNSHFDFAQKVSENPFHPFKTEIDHTMYPILSKLSTDEINDFCDKTHSKNLIPNFTFQSAEDMNKQAESIQSIKWEQCDLKEEFPEYKGSLNFQYRPAWDVYKELFGDPLLKDHLNVSFEEIFKDGERAFWDAHNCWWWEYVQQQQPENSVVFAYMLASDATQVFKKGDVNLKPLYLIMVNASVPWRRSDRFVKLLAHIPILEEDQYTGTAPFHLYTNKVWHRVHQEVLASMKAREVTGAYIRDGFGKIHYGFPRWMYGIYDWPETKFANLTKDTNNTAMPCGQCVVPKSDFGITQPYPLRTPDYMNFVRSKAATLRSHYGSVTDGRNLQKKFSLKDGISFLETLAGGNPYVMANVDLLHLMFSHGLLEYLINFISLYLKEYHPDENNIIRNKINSYLSSVHPFPGMKIFDGDLFSLCDLNLGQREYQSLIFQLPFAMKGVLEDIFVEPCSLLLDWYICAGMEVHTATSLAQLDEIRLKLRESWSIFEEFSKSELRFSKMHQLDHVVLSIFLFGALKHRDANVSERAHIDQIKIGAKKSKGKKVFTRVIKWIEHRHLKQKLLPVPAPANKKIAANRLTKRGSEKCGLYYFQSVDFLDPRSHLQQCLEEFFQVEDLYNMNISVHGSAYIRQPFVDGARRIIASKSFGKNRSSRHDDIAVSVRDKHGTDVLEYAHTHMFFRCKHIVTNEWVDLALIQWYNYVENYSDSLGVTALNRSDICQVIEIDTIIQQTWLFEGDGEIWYVNDFFDNYLKSKQIDIDGLDESDDEEIQSDTEE